MAKETYKYARKIVSGAYDIERVDRVDGGLKQIYLSKEIEAALPGEKFTTCCDGIEACIIFEKALSGADKLVLDDILQAHQTNA